MNQTRLGDSNLLKCYCNKSVCHASTVTRIGSVMYRGGGGRNLSLFKQFLSTFLPFSFLSFPSHSTRVHSSVTTDMNNVGTVPAILRTKRLGSTWETRDPFLVSEKLGRVVLWRCWTFVLSLSLSRSLALSLSLSLSLSRFVCVCVLKRFDG